MSSGRALSLLLFLVDAEDWMATATCRVEKADPNIFVLERGQNTNEAQSYCARCPHRAKCLEYGKKTHSVGVWGGELLTISNQEAVELRPLIMLTDARPMENLVNPPELKNYQDPLSIFA